jgi:hypothetical protein
LSGRCAMCSMPARSGLQTSLFIVHTSNDDQMKHNTNRLHSRSGRRGGATLASPVPGEGSLVREGPLCLLSSL